MQKKSQRALFTIKLFNNQESDTSITFSKQIISDNCHWSKYKYTTKITFLPTNNISQQPSTYNLL